MPQTHQGAMNRLARKAGIPLSLFLAKQAAGLKWCYACQCWKPVRQFGQDRTRWDGLTPLCN
jgi:hypothetical protein